MKKNIGIIVTVLAIIAIVIAVKTSDHRADQGTNSSVTTATHATEPSVTLLAPAGGEKYVAGQQITITWQSQNIPAGANKVKVVLGAFDNKGTLIGGDLLADNLTDSGHATVLLPKTLSAIPGATFGDNFGIYVTISDSANKLIASNNTPANFSISGSSASATIPYDSLAARASANGAYVCGEQTRNGISRDVYCIPVKGGVIQVVGGYNASHRPN
jgi:hypothetical protein